MSYRYDDGIPVRTSYGPTPYASRVAEMFADYEKQPTGKSPIDDTRAIRASELCESGIAYRDVAAAIGIKPTMVQRWIDRGRRLRACGGGVA